jgi:hypothetical protein
MADVLIVLIVGIAADVWRIGRSKVLFDKFVRAAYVFACVGDVFECDCHVGIASSSSLAMQHSLKHDIREIW